ncbi:unnamed protein product [Bemisia tabaci]|uniref:receptor protein-tyrosine kinase n=2 Tax=Bemisia tabaci TaxID=7038 RepID=A0A9P0AH61_BEMTA|nr:unnamed protein product [Bemisia tabaci]
MNDYALQFVVPVPAEIPSLQFRWQNQASKPLPYTIQVDVSNIEAIPTPRLNISSKGYIPTTAETFSVGLPCSGLSDAEVTVHIAINVTTAAHNVTRLSLKRKRFCRKDPNATERGDPVVIMEDTTPVVYIAVSCAFALVILLVIVAMACFVKNNKSRRHGDILQNSRMGSSTSSAHGQVPFMTMPVPVLSCNTSASGSSCNSFRRKPSYARLNDNSKDLQDRIAELTIQRCRVRLHSIVMEGTFGRVYHGAYTMESGKEQEVIVKTVSDHASSMQVSLLLQEGMAMYGLSHKNILSVLGVSIEDHTAPFLIYPHNGFSNLKKFLQKCKAGAGVVNSLTYQSVVEMALQVISGMSHLHKKRLLHKDLAARNCIVDENLRVQIADNALTRDLFPEDYSCLGDNENRPIKWLALESLVNKQFSTASDVWAFGVLLWELTTLAQQPYAEVDAFEMADYLRDGYRLAQPINCPDELFTVMAYCWASSPTERPTSSQLAMCLQEFNTQLTKYV